MTPETLEKLLCSTFCGAVDVRAVPSGLAVASAFKDGSGDPMTFYVTSSEDGVIIEDDGGYLSHLQALDIPFEAGQRGQLLDAILQQGGAYWDRESFEIKTTAFTEEELGRRAIEFMSALIRVRDLELLTREVVRSTFREDAIAALQRTFSGVAVIEEEAVLDSELSEFPADVVIRPRGEAAAPTAVYFVHSNDKLSEALLLQTETLILDRRDVKVIALLEDADMKSISRKRFQRAQNRSLPMPIFRGDEEASMRMIAERAGYPRLSSFGVH
jgi:hypothetical protein